MDTEVFLQKEHRNSIGVHKIGAAISGPSVAGIGSGRPGFGKNFMQENFGLIFRTLSFPIGDCRYRPSIFLQAKNPFESSLPQSPSPLFLRTLLGVACVVLHGPLYCDYSAIGDTISCDAPCNRGPRTLRIF